jgi:hypothetical protein
VLLPIRLAGGPAGGALELLCRSGRNRRGPEAGQKVHGPENGRPADLGSHPEAQWRGARNGTQDGQGRAESGPGCAEEGQGDKTTRGKEDAPTAREGSKKSIILGMLAKGATISELMAAAGWQAHSVRGFLSTVAKQQGIRIESTKNGDGERFYKLAK